MPTSTHTLPNISENLNSIQSADGSCSPDPSPQPVSKDSAKYAQLINITVRLCEITSVRVLGA